MQTDKISFDDLPKDIRMGFKAVAGSLVSLRWDKWKTLEEWKTILEDAMKSGRFDWNYSPIEAGSRNSIRKCKGLRGR